MVAFFLRPGIALEQERGDNIRMFNREEISLQRPAWWLAVPLACGLLLAAGCQDRIPLPPATPGAGIPTVQHPLVTRDLQEIRDEHVLRMITNYNSSGYFIHKGGQAGFDFDLLKKFATEKGITLQVVIPEPGEDMISLLNSGQGDVVAGGIMQNEFLESWAAPTRPTNFVRKVVVWKAKENRSQGWAGLAGLQVVLPREDPFRDQFMNLKENAPVHFFAVQGPPGLQAEDLLVKVSNGEIDATVVNDIVAKAAMSYLPGLEIGPVLTDRWPTVWLVRHNSPDLKAVLNAFLKKHIRMGADRNMRRSQVYGVIYDRYFKNPESIRTMWAPEHRPEKSGRISDFDDVIRNEADPMGMDWRIVTALIYQESRFSPLARSIAGARGLMQVMPQFSGVQADSLFAVRTNIKAGVNLLHTIYNRYAYLDSLDRWRFTLAEYHAGNGHLTDARRLAMDLGRNPNTWRDNIADTLPLLMQRKYYENTRYGYYRGSETVTYVEEILNRYRMYRRLVPLEATLPPRTAQTDSADLAKP